MDQQYKGTDIKEVATFVQALTERAVKAEHANELPHIFSANGEDYIWRGNVYQKMPEAKPKPVRTPDTFIAYPLDGLIDWIKADTDKLFTAENPPALVVVTAPDQVCVKSHALGEAKERALYAKCAYDPPCIAFDTFMDSEALFVALQTCFIPSDCRDVVMRVVNNMTEEQSMQVSDDGVSQRVMVKSGVQEVDKTIFKNPAYLRPMRTFTEVEQVESPFVVRFKEGKRAAIFEADGGQWQVEAVRRVGAYLRERLKDCNVVVIA